MTDWKNATEQDLTDLISNKQQETHYLDFKGRDSLLAAARDKKRQEVGKDISSFAHADGGTIIYGMEEAGQPGVAARLLGFPLADMTKERLTQIIQTSTQPPVVGVFVHPVELKRSDPGNWAYTVTIPQSDTCHQALDMRFHRRDNADTRSMHRDEIVDVMNRARGPKLRLLLSLGDGTNEALIDWVTATRGSHNVYISVTCENDAKIARYVLFRLFLENVPELPAAPFGTSGFQYGVIPALAGVAGSSNGFTMLQFKLVAPPAEPIFTGDRLGLGPLSIQVPKTARDWSGSKRILWECIAPDMVNTHGGVILQKSGDSLRMTEIEETEVTTFFGT